MAAAAEIPYEQSPTAGAAQKRLIKHARTVYRRDDLTGPLALGGLEPLALPFETYRQALTPGLVATVYGSRVTDAMLTDECRYVHSEGDANWWVPSGRMFFSPDPDDGPAEELDGEHRALRLLRPLRPARRGNPRRPRQSRDRRGARRGSDAAAPAARARLPLAAAEDGDGRQPQPLGGRV